MSKKPSYEQLMKRVKDLELEFVEKKQTAESLNKSSECYRLLVERSRDVPYTVKPDGIINFIGPQIKRLGCSPEEVISKHYLDFVAPEQRQHVKQSFEQGTRNRTSLPTEFQWMGKDGSLYWVEAVGEIICDDSGNPVIQVGMLRDISERRRALKKIEDSYHLLQTIIDTIEGEVFVKDNKGKYLFVNRAFASDFGVDSKEVIGKDDYFVFSHDTAAILQENDRRIMAAKKAETIEESTILRGEHVTYLTNKVPLIGDDGNIFGLCGVGFDITRQKEMEQELKKAQFDLERQVKERTSQLTKTIEQLQEAEWRYRTVADFTYDWEYWTNLDGSLKYVSPSCERISGYTPEQFMDKPSLCREIVVPEDREIWDRHFQDSRREFAQREIQFRIKTRTGSICWIEHACQPVFDHKGKNQGVRASNRDITKRIFYRSETQKLQSELAHMDRVVTISALTSALAHEINQPLAAMRSYAQAALRFMNKDHPEYDSVRKALQGIVEDNKRAAEVVNRLRDLVKEGPTHKEAIDINSIIHDVIRLMNSELVLRNASITLNLRPGAPVVQADPIQIQQVLINLLTNALDAMDDQPIDRRTITISTKPENLSEIILSISDSGAGIPPDIIKAIFSPFYTTKSTGMGLGLSICKSIIEAHAGKISAENNPNGGAIFSLILPIASQNK